MKELFSKSWKRLRKNKIIYQLYGFFEKTSGATGNLKRYKAIWVSKWFFQAHGIDYDQTHAPVSKLETLRVLLSISTQRNLSVHQMDLTMVTLNKMRRKRYM